MAPQPNVHAQLRAARESTGLTQRKFATAIRVPWRTYERYERGETKKVPSDVATKALAFAKKHRKRSA